MFQIVFLGKGIWIKGTFQSNKQNFLLFLTLTKPIWILLLVKPIDKQNSFNSFISGYSEPSYTPSPFVQRRLGKNPELGLFSVKKN